MLDDIEARIQVIVPQLLGRDARVTALCDLTTGAENHVLAVDVARDGSEAVQALVLKLYSHGSRAANSDSAVMKKLRALGFPAPEIVHVELDGQRLGRPFVLMQRIEGRALGAVIRAAPAQAEHCPMNVMVDAAGDLYLLDWTLARVTDPRSDLAQTFQMLARRGFDSPRSPITTAYERASGRPLDGMGFFDVFAALKNVAGQYAVLDDGERKRPELWAQLARRPNFEQRAAHLHEAAAPLQRTYRTIVECSGVRVPEAEALFARLLG